MKNKNYAIRTFLIIVVLGLIMVSGCANNNNTINDKSKNIENEHSSLNFETQSSESTVTIDLTPKEFENGKLYVDIGVNTHTVTLSDYDLKSLTVLEFESNSINPVSAPKLSGHHDSGTLIFDIGKELKSFKIVIKDIPNIEERVFEWNIK